MADYKKLATLAREWADRSGFKAAHIERFDGQDASWVGIFDIHTKDDRIDFTRWKPGRYPAATRFSAIAGRKWEKYTEATDSETFSTALEEFSFVTAGGIVLTPGEVSEVVAGGEGPELDDAGLCLLDELEKAFEGLITLKDYDAVEDDDEDEE